MSAECPVCEGFGYTRDSADVMHTVFSLEYRAVVEVETLRKGCGCDLCLGLGHVPSDVRVDYIKRQRRHDVRRIS